MTFYSPRFNPIPKSFYNIAPPMNSIKIKEVIYPAYISIGDSSIKKSTSNSISNKDF